MTMRVRWRGFELPTRVTVDEESRSDTYAKFTTEPFERGFGITVGNSLRRVLLGSLEGAAVTSLKFEGVQHEFTTIPGVYEDVTDIVLNSKGLLVKLTGADAATLKIDVKNRVGPILAKDIEHDHTVEIVNPDLHLATLTEDGHFRCELTVKRGRGYRTAEENAPGPEQEIGVIPVASFFSPVRRVKYKTEYTRVGQLTNYDKLILEIWTNGTVTPDMALVEASKVLRKHLNPFIHYFDVGKESAIDHGGDTGSADDNTDVGEPGLPKETKVNAEAAYHQLMLPLAELDLSVRALNCLEGENIQTIGDLCRRTPDDLMKLRNFGRTTLKEIEKKLEDRELKLGMDVDAILAR